MRRVHRLTASFGEKMDDRREIEARLATMISIIVLIFTVCNSFEAIVFVLSIQEKIFLDIVQKYLRPIADLLLVVNSSVNVIIYVAFKKDFKQKLIELFLQKKCRKSGKQKELAAPVGISMIPMMRAQLPKTSVELTSAASKDQQHETVFGESTPLLQTVNNEDVKPMLSESDTGYDSSFKENASLVKDGTSSTNETNSEISPTLEKDSILDEDKEVTTPLEVIAHLTQGTYLNKKENVEGEETKIDKNEVAQPLGDHIFNIDVDQFARKIASEVLRAAYEEILVH